MYVTVCGKLGSNEGGVVGYVDRMRAKFPAKWGVQMMGMNFQTLSKRKSPSGSDSVPGGLFFTLFQLPALHLRASKALPF